MLRLDGCVFMGERNVSDLVKLNFIVCRIIYFRIFST
jgi:hypothetical protein